MLERNIGKRFDRYFRREDTFVAKGLKKLSPHTGQEYRNSSQKRAVELLIAIPASVVSLPIIAGLAAAVKLQDGGPGFYREKRISKNGDFYVIKIRTMREGADEEPGAAREIAGKFQSENDPRCTKLGQSMRKIDIDELPQLLQVVVGQLSLVDLRASGQQSFDFIKEKRPNDSKSWEEAYSQARPGLFPSNSALNPYRKDEARRTHYDLHYAKNASLGYDLYILWRNGLNILNNLGKLRKLTKA